jgi:hypothetical protein
MAVYDPIQSTKFPQKLVALFPAVTSSSNAKKSDRLESRLCHWIAVRFAAVRFIQFTENVNFFIYKVILKLCHVEITWNLK